MKRGSLTKKGIAPLKICPSDKGGCGTYVASVVLKCPKCQYNFDLARLVTVLNSTRIISPDDRLRMEKYRCLLRQSYQQSFAPSWAAVKFKNEYGFFPPFDWGRGAIFDKKEGATGIYTDYLKKTASRLGKDSGWVQKYLSMEFGTRSAV